MNFLNVTYISFVGEIDTKHKFNQFCSSPERPKNCLTISNISILANNLISHDIFIYDSLIFLNCLYFKMNTKNIKNVTADI